MSNLDTLVEDEKHTRNSKLASPTPSIWSDQVKLVVNGALIGAMSAHYTYLRWKINTEIINQRLSKGFIDGKIHRMEERFPRNLKYGTLMAVRVLYRASSLGSFGILRKRAEASNHGSPLSLYQEAYCGLSAGAIGSSLAYIGDCNYEKSCRMMFHSICRKVADEGVLALWKGGGRRICWLMAFDTGMLASYNPGLRYFEEFFGTRDYKSHLAAGALSGICATACTMPFQIGFIKQPTYTGRIMAMWCCLELMQKLEDRLGL